jgi:hypothetical protein
MMMISQAVHCAVAVYGGAWYPADIRTTDYGVWAEWRRPIRQMKCPLTRKGTRKDSDDGLGDSNRVYARDREQGYLFSAS